jgi:hypothetical protein
MDSGPIERGKILRELFRVKENLVQGKLSENQDAQTFGKAGIVKCRGDFHFGE